MIRPLHRSLVWVPVAVACSHPASPCRADELQITFTIDRMRCLMPTETGLNDRDEVYIVVKSQSSRDRSARRLPAPDDYYEFSAGTRGEVRGWTDEDQRKMGKPILWRGNLGPGETARVMLVIGEQDNADLAAFGDALKTIGEFILTGVGKAMEGNASGAAKAQAEIAGENADAAPDERPMADMLDRMASKIKERGDDVIGDFGLALGNDGGRLKLRWQDGRCKPEHGRDGVFRCRGTHHSSYDLVAGIETKRVPSGTPLPTRRVFLGTEIDQCGESVLRVQSVDASGALRKGDTEEVHVPSRRFWWYCGDSQEWTTAPAGTNLVAVRRDRESRQITWSCYREE